MHDVTNSLDDLWNCLSSGRREIARAWMCRKNTSSHVESIARSATFSEETQRSSQRSTHGHARMCSWVLHLGRKVANHGRCHGLGQLSATGPLEVVTSREETGKNGPPVRRSSGANGPPVRRVPGSPVSHCSFSTFCLGNGSWAISWIPMCVAIKKAQQVDSQQGRGLKHCNSVRMHHTQ